MTGPSTSTTPRPPSRRSRSPVRTPRQTPGTFTSAGLRASRSRIEAWLSSPPSSATTAPTRGNSTAHDGSSAGTAFDRALAANPSSAITWLRSSATFSYIGETREARRRAEIGLRLSPYDAHVFFTYAILALASYADGDYANAVQWARKSHALNPHFTANLRFLVAGLAACDKIDEAREAAAELLRVDPKFSALRFAEGYAFKDPAKRRLFADHLMKAGLPA